MACSTSIVISDVAFRSQEEEVAHFDLLKARLRMISDVYKDLGEAIETMQSMHAVLGTQVTQLQSYIDCLAPQESATDVSVGEKTSVNKDDAAGPANVEVGKTLIRKLGRRWNLKSGFLPPKTALQ
ncbi:hypothetical protein GY45DRAFT_1376394 [Cubamyces sp. BRFM 1775]|nr:hypothetical protein GY45DRAFT_1376394 [Cubamyces sp. BRFM 1775]